MQTTTATTIHSGFSDHRAVRKAIVEWEAREGGAWAYEALFGQVYVTRASIPSRLPDHLSAAFDSNRQIYFRGEWQAYSEAVRVRESNRGIGEG